MNERWSHHRHTHFCNNDCITFNYIFVSYFYLRCTYLS